MYFSYSLILLLMLNACLASVIDLAKTLVWGPGLSPKFSSPIRYFYIQPVDKENQKYCENEF